jgi:precorrin-6A/cobalt-precorrin-6A reductase
MKIWLIGGTGDSGAIGRAIIAGGMPCLVSVTTESARNLYPESPLLTVKVGKLERSAIATMLAQEPIVAIVDASHPYAVEISQSAIELAEQEKMPYLRYERPRLEKQTALELDSFETLLAGNYLAGERVLLTVGYQALPQFQPWQERATLFTRILPIVNSLEVAIAAGFSPDRIIALRPPIAPDLEKALWLQWQITLVVTKASGTEGGEAIKRSVAQELNVPLLVIARPEIFYPRQTDSVSQVLHFCRQHFGENDHVRSDYTRD